MLLAKSAYCPICGASAEHAVRDDEIDEPSRPEPNRAIDAQKRPRKTVFLRGFFYGLIIMVLLGVGIFLTYLVYGGADTSPGEQSTTTTAPAHALTSQEAEHAVVEYIAALGNRNDDLVSQMLQATGSDRPLIAAMLRDDRARAALANRQNLTVSASESPSDDGSTEVTVEWKEEGTDQRSVVHVARYGNDVTINNAWQLPQVVLTDGATADIMINSVAISREGNARVPALMPIHVMSTPHPALANIDEIIASNAARIPLSRQFTADGQRIAADAVEKDLTFRCDGKMTTPPKECFFRYEPRPGYVYRDVRWTIDGKWKESARITSGPSGIVVEATGVRGDATLDYATNVRPTDFQQMTATDTFRGTATVTWKDGTPIVTWKHN